MNIAKNLQYLRKRDKITQEELADRLDVSRQSVSKWETGEAYPETEKLLTLCDMFGVTLDELMRGNLAAASAAPCDEVKEPVTAATDVETYYEHMNKFSRAIALGVFLIIIGVSVCVGLSGYAVTLGDTLSNLVEVLSGVAVIVFVAVSVFLFVFFGMDHTRFINDNKSIERDPDPERAKRFDKKFAVAMACLVSGILIDVVFLIVMTSLIDAGIIAVKIANSAYCYVTAAFLGVLAFLVGGIVFSGMQKAKYNVYEFIKQANTDASSPREKIKGAVCSAVMLTATAVFLLLGFLGSLWHIAWIVFPIGGIVCGIVDVIMKAKDDGK